MTGRGRCDSMVGKELDFKNKPQHQGTTTMKKMKLLACLLALSTVAAASAFAAPGFSLGLGVQYWDAEDADLLDEDGMWGGSVLMRVRPCDYLGIDFRLGGLGIWDSSKWREGGTKYEVDSTFLCCPFEIGLVGMLPLSDVLTLYGGPGVGYYYYDIDIEKSSKHHHHYHSDWTEHIRLEDDFGWFAVAGLNVKLAPCLSLFGEVRYTETETSMKDNKNWKFDASGVGGQVGIMFDF